MIISINNPEPYFATAISQNSNQSIVTPSGVYDFENFSQDEINTIVSVLENTRSKYPRKHQAIGLAIESQGIVYKPRYILFEIIIIKYAASKKHLNQLATGLAYATKGIYFSDDSLRYLEASIVKLSDIEAMRLSRTYPKWWIYHTIALLCEQSYRYSDALKYAGLTIKNKGFVTPYDYTRIGDIYKKINIDRCVSYYENLLNDVSLLGDAYPIVLKKAQEMKELAAREYIFTPRPHKRSKHSIAFEQAVHKAALQFI